MKSIVRKLTGAIQPLPARKGYLRGFTVIELMITIAIFTVMLGIAVPTFQSLVRSDAAAELVGELQLARMIAIRRHTQVTVAFPQAGDDPRQCTITWIDNDGGGVRTKVVDLGRQGEGYRFDDNPPGAGPPAPDNMFIFLPIGFIQTGAGIAGGNVYLINRKSDRFYQIQTTIAGGIQVNRFDPDNNVWVNAY